MSGIEVQLSRVTSLLDALHLSVRKARYGPRTLRHEVSALKGATMLAISNNY
jgi:hypothetical protein